MLHKEVQFKMYVCLLGLEPLIDPDNLSICWSNVDHILCTINTAWNEGNNPATSSDPAYETADQPRQTACPVPQDSLNLCIYSVYSNVAIY